MKALKYILTFLMILTATAAFAQKDQGSTVNQFVVIANNPGPMISKDIYGHFSEHLGRCIYEGLWVGTDSKIPNTYGIRNDVLFALREIKVPNLRWPGGCFADTYHWKDGIGPQEKRSSIVNTHWGGVTEDNSFGTHEFMKLCELLDCDAYINGNVGSGTVREMAEWIEYLTSDSDSPMTRLRKENGREAPWKVKYWAIGNENWGCGGNMTAEFYTDVMRQFSTYLNNYGDNRLYRVACGPSDYNVAWTETLMKDPASRGRFQGLSIHYYSVPDGWSRPKGSSTVFNENAWFKTMQANLQMDEIIRGHEAIMDRYDPRKTKGLVVDEWGNWFDVEPGTNPGFLYQQNSLRDGLTAAIHLNIFNQHAERVKVANLAQIVNVLQSVILTKDDLMVLTPTYHVFRMFRVHQEARLLKTDLKCEDYVFGDRSIPAVSGSASVDKEGKMHISLANLNPNKPVVLNCPIIGETYKKITGEVLTADEMNAYNTFEAAEKVKPAAFNGHSYKNGVLTVSMPPKSVVVLELTK
ncbi:MAG TPA: alpha-N-arabinofuranosidase [Bacteroidales bacterium]|nr:alpha-N-arabinofuranosidase [Bacteroidales bacterium]